MVSVHCAIWILLGLGQLYVSLNGLVLANQSL